MKFTLSIEISRSPNIKHLAKQMDHMVDEFVKDMEANKATPLRPYGAVNGGSVQEAVDTAANLANDGNIQPRPPMLHSTQVPQKILVKDPDGDRERRRQAGLKSFETRKKNEAKAKRAAAKAAKK